MKRFRQMTSLILVLAMLFSFLPVMPVDAKAAEVEETADVTIVQEGSCGEKLTWVFDESTGTLTISGEGDMDDYRNESDVIPWQELQDQIVLVVLEDGVTSIGDFAFKLCSSLMSITIPDSVTSIGYGAFTLCESLKSFTIPSTVTNIDAATFHTCTGLESITIPEGVISIGSAAFLGCSSLTNIEIPASVNNIDWNAFTNCFNLLSITVDSKNNTYASDAAGVLFNKDYTTLVCYPGGLDGEYSIPNGVTTIGDCCFSKNLTRISIPESVTDIGKYAFSGCRDLTNVVIPDSVSNIEYSAFEYCSNLTSIRIPSRLSCIRRYIFESCSNLAYVVIPKSVTSIEWGAFSGCDRLSDVYYTGTEEEWAQIEIDTLQNECLTNATIHFEDGGDNTDDPSQPTVPCKHSYVAVVTAPTCEDQGYTTYTCNICGDSYKDNYVDANGHSYVDGSCAACGGTDPDYIAPDDSIIASGTCGENLTWVLTEDGTLTITGSGEMFNYYAGDDDGPPWLEEDVKVTNIKFDGNITSIGENAFCFTSIKEITIPASVSVIQYGALDYIDTLERIWVDGNNAVYASDDFGVLFNKDKTVLIVAPTKLHGTYTIPESVTWIYDNAFSGCSKIETINCPAGLNQIGPGAFSDCTGLKHISIPHGVTVIDHYTFSGCVNLSEITIPKSITSIGYYAFGNCNLQNIFYAGSEAEWEKIVIDSENEALTNATIYFNSTGPYNVTAQGSWNGHFYEIIDESMTWTEAKAFCEAQGGYLVTITSAEEQAFIEILLPDPYTKHQYWIGATSENGAWEWDNKEIFEYTHWDQNQPDCNGGNEKYALIHNYTSDSSVYPTIQYCWNDVIVDNDYGNDIYNTTTVGLICEYGSDDLAAGSVRYFSEWDAENQIAYFDTNPEEDVLNFGSQVTEDTDQSFLENLDQLINNYVMVKTKPRTDGMIMADTLISIEPLDTGIGKVTAKDAKSISIDGVSYDLPGEDLMMDMIDIGDTVRYHVFEGELVEISLVGTTVGGVVYIEEVSVVCYVNKNSTEDRKESYVLSPNVTATMGPNNTYYTDSKGQVTIRGQQSEIVTFSQEGYISRSFTLKELSYNNVVRLQKKSDAPAIYALWMGDKDILHEEVILRYASDETISVVPEIDWGESGMGSLSLYQEGNSFPLVNGTTTFPLASKFDVTKDIYLVAVNGSGKTSERILKIKSSGTDGWNGFTFKFSDKLSFTLPESAGLLSGTKMSIGLFNSVPVEVVQEDNKVYVAIGFQLEGSMDENGKAKVKDAAESAKSLCKKVANVSNEIEKYKACRDAMKAWGSGLACLQGSFGVDGNLTLMAFAEGYLNNKNEFILTDSGGIMMFSVSADYSQNFMAGPVPMILELGFSGELESQLNLFLNNKIKEFTPKVKINSEVALKLGVGVGLANVASFSGGGKGKLIDTAHFDEGRLKYYKLDGALDWYLKLKVVVASFEWGDTFARKTFYEYPDPGAAVMTLAVEDEAAEVFSGKPDLYDTSQYKVDDLSYLRAGSAFMGGVSTYSRRSLSNDAPFVSNAYEGADPQTASFSDGTRLAVWIGYNDAYSGADALNLYYSYYNGSWSQPQIVEADGTTDAYPDLKVINDTAYLVWQDASRSISSSETLDAIANRMDISGAVFDKGTGLFTSSSITYSSGVLNMLPKLCGDGSAVYVVWHRNGENDWFGQNNSNSLISSRYVNGSWSDVTTLYSGLGPLMDFDVACINGSCSVAYSMDSDCDLNTSEDVEVYRNGTALTSNEYLDSGVCFSGSDLFWYSGGKLLKNGYDTMPEGAFLGSDRFQIINENGIHAVVYAEEDGLASVLYAAYYDSGSEKWGSPIVLYSAGTSISAFSASASANGQINVLIQSQSVTDEFDGTNPYGTVNLIWYNAPMGCNIRVDDIRYYNENYIANEDMPVYITVKNTGELAVQKLLVEFLDSSGTVEQSRIINQPLLSGETKEFAVLYRITKVEQGKALTVRVTPVDKTETSTEDNTGSMMLGWNDLSVENICWGPLADGKVVIHANIVNRGYEKQSRITVNLIENSPTGTVVDTLLLDELEAFALRNISFTISDTLGTIYYVTIDHKDADNNYANDKDFVYIQQDDGSDECIHTYELSGFRWSEDNKCIAIFECVRGDDTQTLDCTVTSSTTPATETEDGVIVYTATIEFCGQTYTDTKTEIFPALTAIRRISGKDRVKTALSVAKALKGTLGVAKFDSVIIATGVNEKFADALAGSYLANVKKAPILLYTNSGLSQLNVNFIKENLRPNGTVYILGGDSAVPTTVEKPLSAYNVVRLSGKTRYETNLAILKEAGISGADEILVATGTNFADSLSASAVGLPLLLVNGKNTAPNAVQTEFLQSVAGKKITILGGDSAVSEEMKASIEKITGVTADRISGKTRHNTSVLIAQKYFPGADFALITYAKNFPDGLAGGPLAYAMGAPLLLTNAGQEGIANGYITAGSIERGYVLGGDSAVSDETARKVFGLATGAVIEKAYYTQ